MNKGNRIVLLAIFSLIALTGLTTHLNTVIGFPADDPVILWSVNDGDTLTGPNAPLTVTWSGDVINNSITITRGISITDLSGVFVNRSEPDHIIQIHVDVAGNYFCELTWDDAVTDIDGYIYTSPSLDSEDGIFNPHWAMATGDYPERSSAYFATGDYWMRVVWYAGNIPINYNYFIGSQDYYLWENTEVSNTQTVNTGVVPDETYSFIATCYDSTGSQFNDTITLTTINQFPPNIDWVKFNGITEDGAIFQRGTELVIEWVAIDPNPGEIIFSTMFFKKPGAFSYSILFSSWLKTNYTINWYSANFEKNGIYRFKLEVNNFNMDSSEPVYFNFQVEGNPLPETSTTVTGTSSSIDTGISTNSTTNPFQYSSPGYTLVITLATLFVTTLFFRRKRI